MRFKDKTEARVTNGSKLIRPKGVSDEQWTRALDLYEVARKKGDKFPELTVAQAALETGWFKHMSGNYNYFGQKASKSQKGTNKITSEYTNNRKFKASEKFRDYDSIEQSMDDRMRKWGAKYAKSKTINEAISAIWEYDPNTGQGKGYATDINYDVKLGKILRMMGVDANTEVKERTEDDRLLSLEALDFQQLPEMARDNTLVANRKLIEPLVINGLNTPENDDKKVTEAKETISEEENKFNFISMVMNAARVDFVEPTETQPKQTSFQEGGENENFLSIIEPLAEKLDKTRQNPDFPDIHPSVQSFLDKTVDATMMDLDGRTFPPVDEDIKELQEIIINMPDKELRELLAKDFSEIGIFNFKKFLPKEVGTGKAIKLLSKYKKLRRKGFTFQEGGEIVEVEEVVDPIQNELEFQNELNKIDKQNKENELARVYMFKNSRVKSALKFRSVAGKRVNKTKLA